MRCPGANPTDEELKEFIGGWAHCSISDCISDLMCVITAKIQITFDEFMSFMNRVTLHEDPTAILQNAFSIFDMYVVVVVVVSVVDDDVCCLLLLFIILWCMLLLHITTLLASRLSSINSTLAGTGRV